MHFPQYAFCASRVLLMFARAVEGLAERCDFSGFLGAVVAVGSHEPVLKFKLANRGRVGNGQVVFSNDLFNVVGNLADLC
ncbi:hypothetical protein PAN31117_03130 [Pandoraea anapnoica]|uniref:Uncharacterized protein n=1 Tax=Pandoraea anapnoica TaxID=2508301 RepID=A0A5E5A750_9BURK|nr:hypothetical protein PAN31117_03130 [Pandoraea anapnoica]